MHTTNMKACVIIEKIPTFLNDSISNFFGDIQDRVIHEISKHFHPAQTSLE